MTHAELTGRNAAPHSHLSDHKEGNNIDTNVMTAIGSVVSDGIVVESLLNGGLVALGLLGSTSLGNLLS